MLNPVRLFVSLLLALPCHLGFAQETQNASAPGISTAEQVQQVPPSEVTNRIPVHLKAVVTFSQERPRSFFVQDSSGGVFVETTSLSALPSVGRLLEIDGFASAGEILPVLVAQQIKDVGPSAYPPARPVLAAQLKAGLFDGDVVKMQGHITKTARSFNPVPLFELHINAEGYAVQVSVTLPSSDFPMPDQLGSLVEVEGVFAPETQGQAQVERITLITPRPEKVRVLKTQDDVAKSLSPDSPSQLLKSTIFIRQEPTRVVGIVSFTNRDACFVTDGRTGVRILVGNRPTLKPGDRVDLFGIGRTNGFGQWVDLVKTLSQSPGRPPAAAKLSPKDLFDPGAFGRLVTVEGQFMHRMPAGVGDILVLSDGAPEMQHSFEAQLRYNASTQIKKLASGSRLRLSGVLWQQDAGSAGEVAPRILVGAASNFVVLTPPPWPLTRTLIIVNILAVSLSAGLVALSAAHRRLKISNRAASAAEKALKQLNTDLEQRIQGRTLELEVANSQLRDEVVESQRLSRRQAELAKVLEMIAQAAPLSETLNQLLRGVETESPDLICSILLLAPDGSHLTHAAAPRLPKSYSEQLKSLPLGPSVGSCGTAAFRREMIIVEDILQDPLWKNYGDLALLSGMRACWSTPILDVRRELLGTFAVYAVRPGRPSEQHKQIIASATHTAAICISRIQAKQALHESEKRFRALVEGTDVIVWEFNPALNVMTYVSPQAARLGYPMSEWLRPGFWQEHLHPEERHEVVEWCEQETAKGHDHRTQYRFATATGAYVWLDDKVSVEARPDGSRTLRGLFIDITDRKQAEADHAKLEARLFQSEKLEALGTLAGGIAHDFNNLLGAIMGYAELTRIDCTHLPSAVENLDDLLKASRRARDLVRQILTFSRHEEPRHRVFALEPVVAESIRLLRATLPTTIEIGSRVVDPVPLILGDPTMIQQVIMNLGTNAAQAIGENSGLIQIELIGWDIPVGGMASRPELKPGSHVRLTVRDNGTGIEPEVRDRIFEPFFTTKERGKGTGLGLAVVHGVIHSHKGVIRVESNPGRGTVFEIYFPSSSQTVEASDNPRLSSVSISRQKGTILLVDDEESLLSIGRRSLSAAGYDVHTCQSSLEALETFRMSPGKFDLLVTDYSMPGCTGVDLGREVRKLRPELPMLICTGYGGSLTRESARELGFHDVLFKPIELDQLCESVQAALKGELTPNKHQ